MRTLHNRTKYSFFIQKTFVVFFSFWRMEKCQTGHIALEMSLFAVNVKCSQFQSVNISPSVTPDSSSVNSKRHASICKPFSHVLKCPNIPSVNSYKSTLFLSFIDISQQYPSHLAKSFNIVWFNQYHPSSVRCDYWLNLSFFTPKLPAGNVYI